MQGFIENFFHEKYEILHSPALHRALDAVAGLEIKGTIDTAKEQNQRALGDEQLIDYEQRYTAIRQAGVEEAGKEAPPASGGRGPQTQSKSQNRLDRLGGGTGRRRWPLKKDVAVPLTLIWPSATCGGGNSSRRDRDVFAAPTAPS
jgi:hypothetical protein